jgi:hypothetical protein
MEIAFSFGICHSFCSTNMFVDTINQWHLDQNDGTWEANHSPHDTIYVLCFMTQLYHLDLAPPKKKKQKYGLVA